MFLLALFLQFTKRCVLVFLEIALIVCPNPSFKRTPAAPLKLNVRPLITKAKGVLMIFAEMVYPNEYWDFHSELKAHVASNFEHWDSGLQSDSWFWIFDGDQKVAIDTFSSMKHQIKSSTPGPLVQRVIDALKIKYEVNVYARPEFEGHEDGYVI